MNRLALLLLPLAAACGSAPASTDILPYASQNGQTLEATAAAPATFSVIVSGTPSCFRAGQPVTSELRYLLDGTATGVAAGSVDQAFLSLAGQSGPGATAAIRTDSRVGLSQIVRGFFDDCPPVASCSRTLEGRLEVVGATTLLTSASAELSLGPSAEACNLSIVLYPTRNN